MLSPDFSDRSYIAEVMRTRTDPDEAIKAIAKLTLEHESESETDENSGRVVKRVPSAHRMQRGVPSLGGETCVA